MTSGRRRLKETLWRASFFSGVFPFPSFLDFAEEINSVAAIRLDLESL